MTLFFHLKARMEQQFREAAMKKYGFTKGALKNALEEAIQDWLQKNGVEKPEENQPTPNHQKQKREVKNNL